jgi:hypothetical protein
MRKNFFFLALLALIGVVFTQMSPASAEFSGTSPSTRELAAQSRPRITIHPRRMHPGPNAKRYCQSWLAREYRVSGPVIVPQMRCWWD